MCEGLWLATADRWFVPQGLALDGNTAWVSGYRYRKAYGDRPCRLLHVDLRTGKVLAATDRLTGSVGDRKATFCRHGGALTLDRHGLWLAEADRLWLVDPARVGRPDQVRRVWRTVRPVRGSALLDGSRTELGLVSFSDRRSGVTRVFSYRDLLAPGVSTLVPGRSSGPGSVGPTRTSSAIRRVQGVTRGPGGVWSTVVGVDLRCARHAGRPTARVRAGSRRPAVRPGRPPVGGARVRRPQLPGRRTSPRPDVARFDVDALRAGPDETCDW